MIAQLEGYRRYFKLPTNAEWALRNNEVKVSNPRVIGVVGNFENYSRPDVDLALEQYKDNITILSYPDIVALLHKADASMT